jgi:hypothetical protein
MSRPLDRLNIVFSAAPVATSSFVLKANASLANICHGRREWVRLVPAGFSVAEVSVKSAMRSARRYRYSTASPRRKSLYVSVFLTAERKMAINW